jgi:hypothetical protein
VQIANPSATGLANPGTGVTCATAVRTVASWFNPRVFTNPRAAIYLELMLKAILVNESSTFS